MWQLSQKYKLFFERFNIRVHWAENRSDHKYTFYLCVRDDLMPIQSILLRFFGLLNKNNKKGELILYS